MSSNVIKVLSKNHANTSNTGLSIVLSTLGVLGLMVVVFLAAASKSYGGELGKRFPEKPADSSLDGLIVGLLFISIVLLICAGIAARSKSVPEHKIANEAGKESNLAEEPAIVGIQKNIVDVPQDIANIGCGPDSVGITMVSKPSPYLASISTCHNNMGLNKQLDSVISGE